MCIICLEFAKGKMTADEAINAGVELCNTDVKLTAEERAHIVDTLIKIATEAENVKKRK